MDTLMASNVFIFLITLAIVPGLAVWQDDLETCGTIPSTKSQAISLKISGGRRSEESAWPWMVNIIHNESGSDEHICGGSLIAPQWVITAAHCVYDDPCMTDRYTLVAGSVKVDGSSNGAQKKRPSKIFIHADYNDDDNDIALFKVPAEEKFDITSSNPKVNTICLPKNDSEYQFQIGQNATVTGWGELPNDPNPTELYEVVLNIMSNKDCRKLWHNDIPDDDICAWINGTKSSPCHGDSGGPLAAELTVSNRTQYYLAGIVSFGQTTVLGQTRSCGNQSLPEVFTRVSQYEDWIRGVLTDEENSVNVANFSCKRKTKSMESGESSSPTLIGNGWTVSLIMFLALAIIIGA